MANDAFKITGAKKQTIADSFKIKLESVENLYSRYSDLIGNIKGQYLAHIMRTMEIYFRRSLQNKYFIISCEPYRTTLTGQKKSSAHYFQGQGFIINYDKSLPEKQARVYIAHELGHLFLIALKDISTKDKRLNMYEGTTEPLSSILGIFTLSDKNDHYSNAESFCYNHANWEEILDDFLNIS
ncbi:MAG: ImmA/IrrE family metallo-endopeptidase [Spirochaetaceae bacterium]|jgi:hypothetical protein|nr:ImmA/IrrE family metallo-endopeptidase [Spirochaetaceae bacterium]